MLPPSPPVRRFPKRPHCALPHRREQCPSWLVEAGMVLLGRWIRESRVLAQLTQVQLALRAGVSQSTVSRLERGVLEGLALYRLAAIIAVLNNASGRDLKSPIGRPG